MCWETAIGIASTVANTMVQAEQSQRQNEAYQANALNANQNATEQYYQNTMQQLQEEAKATQQRNENNEDVLKAKGTAIASTENSGQSTSQVLNDLTRQGAKANNATDVNTKNAQINAKSTADSINKQTQGRIDSVSQGSDVSLAATAINGLGVVVGSYSKNKYTGKDRSDAGAQGVTK